MTRARVPDEGGGGPRDRIAEGEAGLQFLRWTGAVDPELAAAERLLASDSTGPSPLRMDLWWGSRPGAGSGFVVHCGGQGRAGAAWEEGQRLAVEVGGRLAGEAVDRLRRSFESAPLDLAVGLGTAGGRARVKLYLEEQGVGTGTLEASAVTRWVRGLLGDSEPAGLPEGAWDILCLDLGPGERVGCKLYRGAQQPRDLAGRLPGVGPLGDALGRAFPLGVAHSYATLRLGPGGTRRAANVIFAHRAWGVEGTAGQRALLWTQAEAFLRRHNGRVPEGLAAGPPGLRLVPTAAALDEDGADLYVAAFPAPEQPQPP